MNQPLISILITAYNCANYISKAIQSAIDQTYKNIEILISDDCSTDRTLEIIKKWAKLDKRIKYFSTNKNQSIGYWRNKLISEAKGKYFTFLDGDDYFQSKTVEKFLKPIFKNEKDYDLIACKTAVKGISQTDRQRWFTTFVFNNCNSSKNITNIKYASKVLCVLLWGNLINTKFFKSLGIKFEIGRKYEDVGNTLNIILSAKRFSCINYYGYIYVRRMSGNLSNCKHHSTKDITDFVWQLDHLMETLKQKRMLHHPKYHKVIQRFIIAMIFLAYIISTPKLKDTKEIKSVYKRERLRLLYILMVKYKLDMKVSATWWKSALKIFNWVMMRKEFNYICKISKK